MLGIDLNLTNSVCNIIGILEDTLKVTVSAQGFSNVSTLIIIRFFICDVIHAIENGFRSSINSDQNVSGRLYL